MKRSTSRFPTGFVLAALLYIPFGTIAQPTPAPAGSASDPVETLAFVTFAPPTGGSRLLDNCKFSADGKRLLVTTDAPRQGKEVVMVFDVTTGKEVLRREGARPQVAVLMGDAIAPDGSRVLVSETDANLKRRMIVLDVNGGREAWSAQRSIAGDIAFLNDPNLILSGELLESGIRRLTLHDVRAPEPVLKLDLKKGQSPVFTAPPPDGRHLLCLDTEAGLDMYFVFDLKTKAALPNLLGSSRLVMPFLKVTDDRAEVIGFLNGQLARWDASSGKFVRGIPVQDSDRSAFSPDGSRLYVPQGNAITVHDTSDGATVKTARFPLPPVMVAAGPDDLMVLRTIPGQFRIVRLNGGQ